MIPDLSRTSPQASAEQMARSIEQARLLSTLRALGPVGDGPGRTGGADADAAFRLRLIGALGQYADAARRAAGGAQPGEAGAPGARTSAPAAPGDAAVPPFHPVAPGTVAPRPVEVAGGAAVVPPTGTAVERAAGTSGPASRPARAEAPPVPGNPDAFIREVADRHGIDRDFLLALRRVENGGPGREFGVLSVPAPTFADQAQVAAEAVRRDVQRYEGTGRQAVDPATGRYTEGFIRFFSGRYAPIGAENDPKNLNAYHARNLIQRYADMGRQG